MPQIERETGINSGTIHYWIKKHNIKTRDRISEVKRKRRVEWADFHTNSHGHERWQAGDGDGGEDVCYVHRLLAVAEWGFDAVCGNEVHHDNGIPWDNRVENIAPLTVSEHRKEHIDDYRYWDDRYTPWRDKGRLRELYFEQRMSLSEVAEELGCDDKTIRRWMDIYDMDRRSKSEALKQ